MSKKFAPDPTASLRRVQSVRTAIRLSDIKQVSIEDIRTNPSNTLYFASETPEYFRQLREDIEKRGIVVPLLVKKDGTLLAGHNRLQIAREIGLRFVPVQYIQEELSERQEQEFIINDNLLRRHLSNEERIRLYKILFPEFDEVLAASKRGGDKKSETYKRKENQSDNVSLKSSSLPKAQTIQELAQNIAKATGQNIATVKQQMNREKRKKIETSSPTLQKRREQNIIAKQKKNQNDNVSLIERLNKILADIAEAPASTQKKAKTTIEKFVARLSIK